MVSPQKVLYSYYRCVNAVVDKKCENTLMMGGKRLEQYLVNNVEQLMKDHIYSVKKIEEDSKANLPKSNRKAIEKKMLRLNDLYVNGFIDMEKYKSDYAELQEQIVDEAPKEKKDFAALEKFLQSDFKSIYDTLTDVEKQTLWRSVIKEIRVFGKEVVDIKFL